MPDQTANVARGGGKRWSPILLRGLLFLILGLFVLYYTLPLFVMVVTSLKSLPEIRQGALLGLPKEIVLDAWKNAWSED